MLAIPAAVLVYGLSACGGGTRPQVGPSPKPDSGIVFVVPDAGPVDAGELQDSGPSDGGSPDSGTSDGGSGNSDAGVVICGTTDSQLCQTAEAECGTITVVDACGNTRMPNCGDCSGHGICGTTNFCECDTGYADNQGQCILCADETMAMLCTNNDAQCGTATVDDGCGTMVTISCGTCTGANMACNANICACAPGSTPDNGMCLACVAESDAALCADNGYECGMPSVVDNCGTTRTPNCGGCSANAVCDSLEFFCECPPGYNDVNFDASDCEVGIGTPCPTGDGTQQNCPTGQLCEPMAWSPGTNICTTPCQFGECGTNGEVENYCDPTTNLCDLGCDPSLSGSCVNSGFVCYTSEQTFEGLCAVSCTSEPANYCSVTLGGATCDPTGGMCTWTECFQNSDCPTGQACGGSSSDPLAPEEYCVPNCLVPSNACPAHATCNPTTETTCDCDTGYFSPSGTGMDCVPDIGAICPVGDGTQQNCQTGQFCSPLQYADGVSICTNSCQTNADCGTNGSVQNTCNMATGICTLACEATATNPCISSKLVCDQGYCLSNCLDASSNYCSFTLYNGTCTPATGLCSWQACGTGLPACPSGDVCFLDNTTPFTPVQYCVPDCRLSGNENVCQNGFLCDNTNGACDAAPDAGPSDGGTVDAGTTSEPDSGTADAGTNSADDAGTADAGAPDAGSADAGAVSESDAGTQDAGSVTGSDAGPADAGAVTYTLTITNQDDWCDFTIDATAYTGPTASQSFPAGTVVNLTAAPQSGFIWGSWSGTSDDSSMSTTVTMNSDESIQVCCPDTGQTTCP